MDEKLKKILYALGNLTESVKNEEDVIGGGSFGWEISSALQDAEAILNQELGDNWLETDWSQI